MPAGVTSEVKAYQLFINGEPVASNSKKTIPVYDPSTEEVIAQVPDANSDDVNRAVVHHVIANATNKTSNATATATTKAVQTTETTPTDLPQVVAHKDNDITAMLGLASGPGSVTHTAQPQVLQMQSSVDSSGFAQELGQQVAWMGGQDIKEARIKLNPEALGELEVKVSVDHNRVDVAFAAQHPAAVTAVQQTLGQLDTMLAGHGLSLGHTFVGQQHQGSDGSSSSSGKGSFAGNDAADGDAEVSPIRQVAVGLVDMFA